MISYVRGRERTQQLVHAAAALLGVPCITPCRNCNGKNEDYKAITRFKGAYNDADSGSPDVCDEVEILLQTNWRSRRRDTRARVTRQHAGRRGEGTWRRAR